jgi:hypothetical protein
MADIGTGTSISWESFLGELLDVNPPGASREAIDVSHMGTGSSHIFTPADLVDWGEMTVTIAYDPSDTPPIDSAASSCTITFPDGSIWVFNAFMTSMKPAVPLEDKMTAEVTVKVTGDLAIT